MAILLHGTTRNRAERIASDGPDPDFVEPNDPGSFEGFSTCLESGPFPFGTPDEYASQKAVLFPNEVGPAILAVNVPGEIIALAVDENLPLSKGLVRFDVGSELEELRTAWPTLWKEVRNL